MANTFVFKEVFAKEQQVQFYKKNVAKAIADMSPQSELKRGDKFHKQYRSGGRPARYVRGNDINIKDFANTDEVLTVNDEFADGFYVDEHDSIQSQHNDAVNYGKDQAEYLSNQIDADVLGEYQNAGITIDDGSIGGTAGNGITVTTSNIFKIFAAVKRELKKKNVPATDLYAVVSPDVEFIMEEQVANKATSYGDGTTKNGFFGMYNGFSLHSSNQTAGSALLALATQPTNGDTVIIEGVTFTFVSSIGSTAGNVLIGANVDATRANLAGLINNPATSNSTQIALSADNQLLFENASATNNDTANTLSLIFKGVGVLTVDETLTDGTDTWTATKTKQHLVFGQRGGISLVVQRMPKVKIVDETKKMGKNYLNSILYGRKVFNDGAKKTINVEINASTFA